MNSSAVANQWQADNSNLQATRLTTRVLLVEDDNEVVAFLTKLLVFLGYEVQRVHDGAEALRWLCRALPDAIITDILMPHMDGLRLTRALRHDPRTCLIPVIMLSARAELHERLEGFKAGADDYLVKPFDILELKARLESILLRSQREIWCNPISHLPGSPGIEAEVTRRLQSQRPFAFAYLDIDDFKAYNDVYGYHAGDQVIKDLSGLLMEFSISSSFTEAYAGHIGGDDFVFLGAPAYMVASLPGLLRRFDAITGHYYSPGHRDKGGIVTPNRQGHDQFFPQMTLSAAVVNTASRRIRHYAELAEIVSELKHYLKAQPPEGKSRCLWEERSEPPKRIIL